MFVSANDTLFMLISTERFYNEKNILGNASIDSFLSADQQVVPSTKNSKNHKYIKSL